MSRISAERMQKALEQQKAISQEDYAKVKALAAIVKTPRSFIAAVVLAAASVPCAAPGFRGTSASRGATVGFPWFPYRSRR